MGGVEPSASEQSRGLSLVYLTGLGIGVRVHITRCLRRPIAAAPSRIWHIEWWNRASQAHGHEC